MIMFLSLRKNQSAASLFLPIILVVLLILPLSCASFGQKRKLNEVKSKVEATWILEEWHMKGEVVRPPKVDGRFVIHDNVFVVMLLNRAGEEPWSYYGFGKYTLDASTFSMGFDETSFFKESTSGVTVSRKLTWDGEMKSFGLDMENNQLHMRTADGSLELIVDGNSLIYKQSGEIARIYRRAGAE
jgi:hypothetical protein